MSKIVPIHSVDELVNIDYQDKVTYKLENDLEIDSEFRPVQNFKGVFDGNGKTIVIKSIGHSLTSFAIFEFNGGVIKNLNVKLKVTNGLYLNRFGSIAVYNFGVVINCHVISMYELKFSSRNFARIGGVVCENYGLIKDSSFCGSVKINSNSDVSFDCDVGGIASVSEYDMFHIYLPNLDTTIKLDEYRDIIRSNLKTKYLFKRKLKKRTLETYSCIVDCSSVLSITSHAEIDENEGSIYFGGIVGYLVSSVVDSCFSCLFVHSKNSVSGGIVGINEKETLIENCLAISLQKSERGSVGGILGEFNLNGSQSHCVIDSVMACSLLSSLYMGGVIGTSILCYDYTGVEILNSYIFTKQHRRFSEDRITKYRADSSNEIGASGGIIGYSKWNYVSNCSVSYFSEGSARYRCGVLFGTSNQDNVHLINAKVVSFSGKPVFSVLTDRLRYGSFENIKVFVQQVDTDEVSILNRGSNSVLKHVLITLGDNVDTQKVKTVLVSNKDFESDSDDDYDYYYDDEDSESLVLSNSKITKKGG